MRVLILSATTGGGHMRAANALKEYILSKESNAVIRIEDAIQYCSPFLNKAVTGGYVYMAKNTPTMYGVVYKTTDKKTPINKTMTMTTSFLEKYLMPLIDEFRPDIVVTTHALSAEIISGIKSKGLINIPIISIATDFAIHQSYVADGIDAYIVSSREMVNQFVERGEERVSIYPYGIPVMQEFYQDIDREEAFRSEGLDSSLPTILIMAGSFGVTDILKIYHKIVESPEEFQVIVITGKNEKLYNTFEKYLRKITMKNTLAAIRDELNPEKAAQKPRPRRPAKPTKLLYFTNEVHKYMHMADLIVTKPGGLTVTESIATGLPMGIFKAIPGQEEQNADFLVSKKMAVRLEKNNTCTQTITDLLQHREKLEAMKTAIRSFSKGNSAANIYLLMKELIERYKTKNS